MRVVLITATSGTQDDDETPLLAKLLKDSHNVDTVTVAWDQEDVFEHWHQSDLGIIQATWNYHLKFDAFVSWLNEVERRGLKVFNTVSTLRVNIHKSYLKQLEEQGVPIVPTVCCDKTSQLNVPQLLHDRGWTHVVIKPAVGASSYKTKHFSAEESVEAQAFFDSLVAERDVMVQKFMHTIRTRGETSLVWFGGSLSHAVTKRATFYGDQLHFPKACDTPTPEQEEFVKRVLATQQEPCLYARVDVMYGEDGAMLLSELELTEPYLYLTTCPTAPAAYAAAIAKEFHQHHQQQQQQQQQGEAEASRGTGATSTSADS